MGDECHTATAASKTRVSTELQGPWIGHDGDVIDQMTRTLLIVDDHASFRTFVRSFLDGEEFKVTGEAGDGSTALEEAARLEPQVVLLDVQLGDGPDGFEVADRLAASPYPPQVVLTSSRKASDYGSRLTMAPVSGFLPKNELSTDNLTALLG